ncbi:MAG: sulfotransferase family protein [Actinomycetota bacterium]|nr:sulfotransferase family protein [Actinomycetota bacterium]
MVLPDLDLVFLAYNKAGSSSIEAALRGHRSTVWEAYARVGHKALRRPGPWKHMNAREFERLFGWRSGVIGMHRVAVVRNPWDRMVSVYHYQRQTVPDKHEKATSLDFRDYVLSGGSGSAFTTFADFAGDGQGALKVDTVLRVESLDDDFSTLCAARGLTGVSLPRKNTSARGDYREMYDDETHAVVARAFAVDIERFGYAF